MPDPAANEEKARYETRSPCPALLAAIAALACAVLLAACGDDDNSSSDSTASTSGEADQEQPGQRRQELTVGSKNFTEQFILGEIYAQALQAAGYEVKKDLNLGSEQIALKALKSGDIDGYPEYTSTALTSFFDVQPQDIPKDAAAGGRRRAEQIRGGGPGRLRPHAVHERERRRHAEEEGRRAGRDRGLRPEGQVAGPDALRLARVPPAAGLPGRAQQDYGLKFKKFTPVDIGLRYEVLDKGQADLSIIFTTDAQLSTRDDVVTLEDDKKVFPPGNVTFVASKKTADAPAPT